MHRAIVSSSFALLVACSGGAGGQDAPPELSDVAVTTAEDTPVSVVVAASQALSLSIATAPSHGELAGDGPTWTYTPEPDYAGTDSVAVRGDSDSGSATAAVTITVTPVNDAPVASPDTLSTAFDTPLTAAQATLLANDSDVDDAELSVSAVEAVEDGHGVPALSGSDVVFTPDPGFSGAATFAYTVSDGELTAQGTVTVSVGASAAPVAVDDAVTVAGDSGANSLDVLANDTDADGGPMTVASVGQPGHGAAAVGAEGASVTYTPAGGYCNQAPNAPPDSFTYTLAGGSTATVTVAVSCVCGQATATDFIVGSN